MKLVNTIALSALLIGSFNVSAQTDTKRTTVNGPIVASSVKSMEISPEQRGEARAKQLSEKVTLSDDQFAKVKELFTNIELKNKGVQDNVNISPEQKIEIVKSNNEYEQDALKEILTPEQLKKLETAPPANNNIVK